MQDFMMKSRPVLFFAALCVFALTASEARPATCGASSSGVAFGNYEALASSARDTLSTITVQCYGKVGEKVSYSIALNRSIHGSHDRIMVRSVDQLHYALFIDPARTQTWGDGTGGSSVIADSFYLDHVQMSRRYTIYARIVGGQKTNPAGSYNDIATIMLSY
jgi:spore coat protein U-like protein